MKKEGRDFLSYLNAVVIGALIGVSGGYQIGFKYGLKEKPPKQSASTKPLQVPTSAEEMEAIANKFADAQTAYRNSLYSLQEQNAKTMALHDRMVISFATNGIVRESGGKVYAVIPGSFRLVNTNGLLEEVVK